MTPEKKRILDEWKQKWNNDEFFSDYSNVIDPVKIEEFLSSSLDSLIQSVREEEKIEGIAEESIGCLEYCKKARSERTQEIAEMVERDIWD